MRTEPGPLIASDSKFNTILSGLTWHMLLRRFLNFCSCTTLFLDLDDSVRINRAWIYKEPKANVNLVQRGECWTCNQRLWEAWILFPLGVTFFIGPFYFHVVKPLMPILALLPFLCISKKNCNGKLNTNDLCTGIFVLGNSLLPYQLDFLVCRWLFTKSHSQYK